MFIAGGTHRGGERRFIIGLCEEDISRMKQGSPVEVDGLSIGMPGKLVVFYGATEASIIEEFSKAGVQIPGQNSSDR